MIDGWVPEARAADLQRALTAMPGVVAEIVETAEAGHPETHETEAPPVLLKHRGPVRRFEFLTKLYSTPSHDEIDPTAFLFLLFPLFFGLMIGDAGYGIVMIVLGFVLSSKLKDSPNFADLMRVILYGGVFAYIFGMVLYGEIFGIPFHAPLEHPTELSWSALLGYNIPYTPPIQKLEAFGVIDLLLISVVASFIHLSIAMTFPYFAVACIVIGIVILLPTEGGLAPVETISLLANMMSYTRLAGVAVAKGAVALAFNTMLLPLIINEGLFETTGAIQWNSNIVMIVLGFILLFLAHAMVLILGAISASIQAIRLNYVEFFLKFYKGGGTLFSPFGERKREMEA